MKITHFYFILNTHSKGIFLNPSLHSVRVLFALENSGIGFAILCGVRLVGGVSFISCRNFSQTLPFFKQEEKGKSIDIEVENTGMEFESEQVLNVSVDSSQVIINSTVYDIDLYENKAGLFLPPLKEVRETLKRRRYIEINETINSKHFEYLEKILFNLWEVSRNQTEENENYDVFIYYCIDGDKIKFDNIG